jgi:lysophospholipase L1-like esterase
MKNILRTFLLVVVLVLLTVLKHVLDRHSPTSVIFHYNFLTGIQYFLLLAVLFYLLLYGFFKFILKRRLKAVTFWIVFLSIFTISEGIIFYFLRNTEKIPASLDRFITEYYLTYEINFPQLSYDTALTYTLKKNSVYDHANLEFRNNIAVNSMGLRDNEDALKSPEIICLGDSYTMGWGVEQSQSYPKLIQQTTGKKVLNAGISSYGTVRELMLLNRLDTSNLKYLIIQYCYNDWSENKAFLDSNRYIPSGSQTTLDRTFRSYRLARKYFPFKYTLTLLRMFVRNQLIKKEKNKEPLAWVRSLDYVQPAADAFLQILSQSNLNFRKLKIILIDTNRYPAYEHYWLEAVEKELQSTAYSNDMRQSIHIVKFPELNHQKYFYPLDNHLNEAGHQVIANTILQMMDKLK